jgi:hypothetical protein
VLGHRVERVAYEDTWRRLWVAEAGISRYLLENRSRELAGGAVDRPGAEALKPKDLR